MLNSTQILEKNLLKLEHSKGKAAQIGYDLSIKSVKSLSGAGRILKDKTLLPSYIELEKLTENGWNLTEGYYEVTFWEGCKIPNNLVGLIRQRSSMLRSGALLHSSVFDPGFETDFMGSFIAVFKNIYIEQDARIAQIYFHECESVLETYTGQFQFDKQRK